jgi:RNA polymerase sigma factor (sigma-70 family)
MFKTKRQSIGELFEGNRRGLMNYLTRKVGREDAADLLQETFVRAMRHNGLDTVVDPPAYLQKIAVNLTRDFERRARTQEKYLEFGDLPIDMPGAEPAVDEAIELEQKRQLVITAIESLPPQCGVVFSLVMHHGLSAKQVAQQLGITETMVRRHLNTAILRCRNSVSE